MLDPMSALSAAAASVQFVDFSLELISKSKEIYKSTSGTLEEFTEIMRSTKLLTHRKVEVQEALNVGTLRPPLAITAAQADLLELCGNYLKIGERLEDQLAKLKIVEETKHRRWQSLKQAIKSGWGKKEIRVTYDSLSSSKSDLMLYILVSVQYVSRIHPVNCSTLLQIPC